MSSSFPSMSRRQLIQAFSLAAVGAGLAGLPMPGNAAQKSPIAGGRPIRLGIIAPSHCALTMLHAQLAGFYGKNGIAAEIHYLRTSAEIAKQLASGALDVGQIITPTFYAVNLGLGPFAGHQKALVTAQIAGSNGGVLVVGWDSPVKSPQDLKGKTIGVHSYYMTHSLIINRLLRSHGLDPKKDVTVKAVPMHEMIGALESGEVEAFINPEPLGTFALERAVGKELLITKRLWRNHPCCLVAMRRDYFEQDVDRGKAIYRASLESGLVLDNFRTRIEAIESAHARSDQYREIPLETVIKAFVPGRSDFSPFPFQSSARAVLLMMRDEGLVPDGTDINAVVKQTFLSDLSRELLAGLGAEPPEGNDRLETIVGRVVGS